MADEEQEEGKLAKAWHKVEEATGGTHKSVPVAGDQREGNFEDIESSRVAESG